MTHTPQVYSLFSKTLHWSMAFLILGLLFAGFWMVGMSFSPAKLALYGLHKSFGMTVFFLGSVRLIWRFMMPAPKPLDSHVALEMFLAKTIHGVFYICFIGMPLSGWAMSNAGEFPNVFFGLFEFPHIVSKNEQTFETLKWVHELFAYGLIGCLALHVAGALKHHVIDRDVTLVRMGGRSVFGFLALALFGSVLVLKGAQIYAQWQAMNVEAIPTERVVEAVQRDTMRADVEKWLIEKQSSRLDFQFTQYGQAVNGYFEDWDGDIFFDPQALEKSTVTIRIHPASIRTGSADRDAQAQGSDWFDVSGFPEIVFRSESFRTLEPNRYQMVGLLRIKEIEQPVSFPFLLSIETDAQGQKRGIMQANLTLNRLDFGVGQGDWESSETIGNAVNIDIYLEAITP